MQTNKIAHKCFYIEDNVCIRETKLDFATATTYATLKSKGRQS